MLGDDELNPEYPELEYPTDLYVLEDGQVILADSEESRLMQMCAAAGMNLNEYRAYMAIRGKPPC